MCAPVWGRNRRGRCHHFDCCIRGVGYIPGVAGQFGALCGPFRALPALPLAFSWGLCACYACRPCVRRMPGATVAASAELESSLHNHHLAPLSFGSLWLGLLPGTRRDATASRDLGVGPQRTAARIPSCRCAREGGSRGSALAFHSVLCWLSWARSTRRDASSDASRSSPMRCQRRSRSSLPPTLPAKSAALLAQCRRWTLPSFSHRVFSLHLLCVCATLQGIERVCMMAARCVTARPRGRRPSARVFCLYVVIPPV